jgi:hypothetical protein
MRDYEVTITERLSSVVAVRAENTDDAEDRARAMYRNSGVILTAEDYVDTEFSVIHDESEDADSVGSRKCICGNTRFTAQHPDKRAAMMKG